MANIAFINGQVITVNTEDQIVEAVMVSARIIT